MAGRLIERIATAEALAAAWDDVLSRADDEEPSPSVTRFAEGVEEKLATLAAELSAGEYRPGLLNEVRIPKDDGSFRSLRVPTVRDRVVERAILDVVTPFADGWLSSASYAYRAGIGVADAVQAVARLRDEGFGWVLRADVADCFDTVPAARAHRLLVTMLPDLSLDELIAALLHRRVNTRHGVREVRGVPQGTSLAPLLANLVLDELDNALLDRGFALVRFADDFAVVCDSPTDAREAARVAAGALEEFDMELSEEKTRVMSFAEGFTFLGEDFGPRYPPVFPEHRLADTTRKVVYVGLQGSRVRLQEGRIKVESRDDAELLDVPSSHVARVVCFGSVGVSAGIRSWALNEDVGVVFLSRKGNYLGQLHGANSGSRIGRLRAQFRAVEDADVALGFARSVVGTKVRHQVTVVQRFGTREAADDTVRLIAQMRSMSSMLAAAQTSDEVMGIEGAAARAYFEALGHLVPEELRFEGRNRRPPTDVVNSALGYGYAMLLGECVSALIAAGLDPAVGLLHAPADRRPSLALDLMEEFRPMIVDQVVLTLVRRASLTREHELRRPKQPGVLLTKAGKLALTEAYERRMLQMTSGALAGFSGSLRRHVYRQAERLAAYIENPAVGWSGLSWR